ncbi:MAG: PEP/pyruvate-binding domain-containing protein [Streptosporangiaceae bacterium]
MTPAVDLVLDLDDIRITDSSRVGPKVARLGQLAAAGWRVPDGYAVTAHALEDWLPAAARSELKRLFSDQATGQVADLAMIGRICTQAQALIESQPLPPWLEDAIVVAHERLQERTGRGSGLRVAVRSSAVGEDGLRASFAGQYATYLGISGIADVLHHIRKCWASGYGAHAVEYRRRAGFDPLGSHELAVGILELVDARSAGVVFTLDPVTGDRGHLVIEANWGFGESVVSGQVTPDHWIVDRASGHILDQTLSVKQAWSVFDPAAARVVLGPLPAELTEQASLADREVRYLCQKAAEIEDAEGAPQDVEWAIARNVPFPDSVYILQHRPETTWSARSPSPLPPDPGAARPDRAFDPVQYALRNVFKVPST